MMKVCKPEEFVPRASTKKPDGFRFAGDKLQMCKEEDSRAKILKMADMRKKTIEKEIDRLSTMDEVKCKILGISRDEILNG